MTTEDICHRLTIRLRAAHVKVVNDSMKHMGHAGARQGGGHYIVTVVSDAFAGKSQVQRHRLVYDALRDEMRTTIHALAITALTPEERAR